MTTTTQKNRTPKPNKFHEILSSIIPADLIDSISSHVKDHASYQSKRN